MYHVRAFFLRAFFFCGIMTFSDYVLFIHNIFIFKRKAYCGFCFAHRTVSVAAVYQLKIIYMYDQD